MKIEETLGNHLRNLMGPYQTLIDTIKLYKATGDTKYLDSLDVSNIKGQFDNMLRFSKTEQMESHAWRHNTDTSGPLGY